MPFITANNIRLFYEERGTGDPVLLLHGLGSSVRDWENQLDQIGHRYRVIAVDLRGHGRSDKPPGPYSVTQFVDDVVAMLHSLAAVPVHVAGLSMGGMIAFQLAVNHPEMLKTLIVVNSGPALILHTLKLKLEFKRREWTVRLLGMRKMGQILADKLLPEPHQRHLHDEFVRRWAQNDRQAYLASLRAIIGWSVADRIHNIKCPALIVSADEDYTPVSMKQAYAAHMSDAAVAVIDQSRHMTPIDQADAFNRTVEAFLSAHSEPLTPER